MPTRLHKDAVIGNRHPIHALSEFTDETARDAHTYLSEDIGKVVSTGTGSGRQFWLVQNVASGNGSFLELGAGGGAPDAHDTSHENGGTDEISVAGLSGLLADAQTPLAHATSHENGGSDEIKLDDLAAPDDNTDLDVSTSAHGLVPKIPSGSAARVLSHPGSGADAVWSSIFSGGTGSDGVYFGDAAPISPSSYDDEFSTDASGVPSGWTEMDPGSLLTVTAHNGFVEMLSPTNATIQLRGIYKAVPTEAEWLAYSHVLVRGSMPTTAVSLQMGIFLAENAAAPTTAKFEAVSASVNDDENGGARVQQWADYNSLTATRRLSTGAGIDWIVAFGYDGTNFYAYLMSPTGSMILLASYAKPFTPTHMGISVMNTSGANAYCMSDWIRVKVGTGVATPGFTLYGGQRV